MHPPGTRFSPISPSGGALCGHQNDQAPRAANFFATLRATFAPTESLAMVEPLKLPYEVLTPYRAQIGESPLWSVVEQAIYWVDIEGRSLQRLDWSTRTTARWHLPERPGSIALISSGGLLVAMESGIFRFVPSLPVTTDSALALHSGALERLASVQFERTDMRFNDGRCDRAGRFWVSSMVLDTSLGIPAGALFRFDENGLSGPLLEGLITGNGLACSPDGKTLYLADSNRNVQKVWTFELDAAGALSNQQVWVDFASLPGRPDGAAVDSEGCYWVCATDAGQVHRFRPDGVLERSLAVPFAKPTTCVFGGPNLDYLLVASLQTAKPVEGFDAALAGALIALQPGVRGLPESLFNR
jgi:hypothetical protein